MRTAVQKGVGLQLLSCCLPSTIPTAGFLGKNVLLRSGLCPSSPLSEAAGPSTAAFPAKLLPFASYQMPGRVL